MIEFLLHAENIPFAIASALVALIAVAEAAALLLGGDLLGLDGDGPEAEAGVDGVPVLSWLGVGRVPLLVVLISLCAAFGAAGYAIQAFAAAAGSLLPSWTASLAALGAALPATRLLASAVARLVPGDETAAVSTDSFVGAQAVITTGTARAGLAAEAKLTDAHGRSHYVMVVPAEGVGELPSGTEILLVERTDAAFLALPLRDPALPAPDAPPRGL